MSWTASRPETGRLRLAFGLRWRPQEGRDERDPQTRLAPALRLAVGPQSAKTKPHLNPHRRKELTWPAPKNSSKRSIG